MDHYQPLLLLIFYLMSLSNSLTPPRSHNCTSPVNLVRPVLTPIEISQEVIPSMLYASPRKVEGFVITARKWKSYCKRCLLCDPMEHCTTEESIVRPSNDLGDEVLSKKKCPLGPTCEPSSDECLGGGLIHCNTNQTNVVWSGNRHYSFRGAFKTSAFGDSCVQDWECRIKTIMFPISLYGSLSNGVWAQTGAVTGDVIILSKTGSTTFIDAAGNFHVIGFSKINIKKPINSRCIRSGRRMACLVDPTPLNSHTMVFNVDGEGYGRQDNMLMKLNSRMNLDGIDQPYNTLGSSATIDQVHSVLNRLMYEQLQSQMNSLDLAVSLFYTQDLLYKTIKSLLKSNQQLLPDLIGVSGRTQWLGGETNILCPCASTPTDGTMCSATHVWEEERWRKEDDSCLDRLPLPEKRRVNVTLFHNTTLLADLIPDEELLVSTGSQFSQTHTGEDGVTITAGDSNQRLYWFSTMIAWILSFKDQYLFLGSSFGWLVILSKFSLVSNQCHENQS